MRDENVPLLHPELDWSRVELDPTEGFILSRVDGRSQVSEICLGSGIGQERALEVLSKLRRLGLIYLKDEPVPPPPGSDSEAAEQQGDEGGPGPPLSDSVELLLKGFVDSDSGLYEPMQPLAPSPEPSAGSSAGSDPGAAEQSAGITPPQETDEPGAAEQGAGTTPPRETDEPGAAGAAAAVLEPEPGTSESGVLEELLEAYVGDDAGKLDDVVLEPDPVSTSPEQEEDLARGIDDSDELIPGAHVASGIEFVEHEGVNLPRAELEEDVDLPEDQRKEILIRFYRLNEADYYSFLGIDPSAKRKEVKRAFRVVSRKFHPDRFYQGNLGSYRAKVETLFKFAKRANDVLLDAQLREQYDATREVEAPTANQAVQPTSSRAPRMHAERPARPAPSAPKGPRELTEEKRRQIDTLFDQLDTIDHYSLLELQAGATRKEVKRAYFRLSKGYHPDRHRNRDLGPYEKRIAAIFKALTTAHKYLLDAERRRAYQEKLGPGPRGPVTPVPSQVPTRVEAPGAEAEEKREKRRARSAEADQRRKRRRTEPPKQPSAEEEERTERRRERRKHAFLRRGPGGSRLDRARRFVATGREDLAAERWASAASNFRLAQSYGEEDPTIEVLYEKAQGEAQKLAAGNYIRQADYAHSVGDRKAAAELCNRAAQAHATPENLHRAAMALLRSNGDLHRAQDYAMRAAEAEPEIPEYRMTLGLVYEAAGLLKNALRELQAVQAKAPKLPGLREQIYALKKRL